jgi:hypothetical protein
VLFYSAGKSDMAFLQHSIQATFRKWFLRGFPAADLPFSVQAFLPYSSWQILYAVIEKLLNHKFKRMQGKPLEMALKRA